MVSWNMGMWVRGLQEATTTRLSLFSLMAVQDLVLGVGGAGEQVLVGQDHPRQGGDIFGEGRDVDDPADVDAAVADKDADPGFLAARRPISGGSSGFLMAGAPGRAQEFAGGGRGGGGLHDRLGDVLGGLEDAADIDARLDWCSPA